MTNARTELGREAPGFLFDLDLCTGCCACELACSTENRLGWGRSWRQVLTFNASKVPSVPTYHLSLACNHCGDAPCMNACPALAIERNPLTGAVLIDSRRCIGCRYCAWACPFEAPVYDEQHQIMGKCTWCDHRLVDNRQPACVEQCPTNALAFGLLEGAEDVPGFPATSARPAIRFQPLSRGRQSGPETSWEIPREIVESFASARPPRKNEISLRSEWPLWIFTLLSSLLVGWIIAASAGGQPPALGVFLGLAAVATGASTLHLGRKSRAWRAALNLRRSWLSREIVFFSLFVAASAAFCALPNLRLVGMSAAIVGGLTLMAVDRVYDVVRPRTAPRLHSADVLLTGSLVAALLLGQRPLAMAVMAVKLALYTGQTIRWLGSPDVDSLATIWSVRVPRIALGFVLPLAIWVLAPETGGAWAVVSIAAGEIVDRAQFYNELEIVSPRQQIAIDQARHREEAFQQARQPAG